MNQAEVTSHVSTVWNNGYLEGKREAYRRIAALVKEKALYHFLEHQDVSAMALREVYFIADEEWESLTDQLDHNSFQDAKNKIVGLGNGIEDTRI